MNHSCTAPCVSSSFFFFITLTPRVERYTKSTSLKYEPASEPPCVTHERSLHLYRHIINRHFDQIYGRNLKSNGRPLGYIGTGAMHAPPHVCCAARLKGETEPREANPRAEENRAQGFGFGVEGLRNRTMGREEIEKESDRARARERARASERLRARR